jgi:hypothetical protein
MADYNACFAKEPRLTKDLHWSASEGQVGGWLDAVHLGGLDRRALPNATPSVSALLPLPSDGPVSDGGARHWAIVASLVADREVKRVEPQAWLTDVLERMVSGRTEAHELERLLPWSWKAEQLVAAVHA